MAIDRPKTRVKRGRTETIRAALTRKGVPIPPELRAKKRKPPTNPKTTADLLAELRALVAISGRPRTRAERSRTGRVRASLTRHGVPIPPELSAQKRKPRSGPKTPPKTPADLLVELRALVAIDGRPRTTAEHTRTYTVRAGLVRQGVLIPPELRARKTKKPSQSCGS